MTDDLIRKTLASFDSLGGPGTGAVIEVISELHRRIIELERQMPVMGH